MEDPFKPEPRCELEIGHFVRGGLPGLARLQLVLPSLFAYYKVVGLDEQARCLRSAGLTPVRTKVDITFVMPEPEEPSPSLLDRPPSPL